MIVDNNVTKFDNMNAMKVQSGHSSTLWVLVSHYANKNYTYIQCKAFYVHFARFKDNTFINPVYSTVYLSFFCNCNKAANTLDKIAANISDSLIYASEKSESNDVDN